MLVYENLGKKLRCDLVQYIWEKLGPEYRAIVLQRRQVL